MNKPIDVTLYFNFRSPYCYLLSKTMWPVLDDFDVNLVWRPVGGWNLRSSPERAKKKLPIARQDLKRFAKRLGIPVNPPPMETEPTPAGAASFYAEAQGKLREYIIETMREEWEFGNNIALDKSLRNIANRCGLDADTLIAASGDARNLAILENNAKLADADGAVGVPTFIIGDQIFWGQDRVEFVIEHLQDLGASKA
jgi:2-hydroxychromene-2-carboxylate isomerase